MNNFGIPLAVIAATVIGGAVVLDHTLKNDEPVAPRAAAKPATVTESNATPTVASESTNGNAESAVKVADAGKDVSEAPPKRIASVTPQPNDGSKSAKSSSKAGARASRASASNAESAPTPGPATAGTTVNVETPASSVAMAPSTSMPAPTVAPTPSAAPQPSASSMGDASPAPAPSAAPPSTTTASAPSANTSSTNAEANETK